MGKQARIRRERRDTTGLAGAYKRAMRRIGQRVDLVSAQMRKPDFIASLKSRADLLVGTPGEITSEAGVVELARQLLEQSMVDHAGVLITCKLAYGRLQFWTRISPQASAVAAAEAREALADRLPSSAVREDMARAAGPVAA